MRVKKVNVEYCTHLTINWGRAEETNQDKNYDREAGQARSGVDLSARGWIKTRETQSEALSSRTHIVHR
jgi:hypothetical protein